MSRAGINELPATSIVGARIRNSAERRQLRINAVSIIAAANVDLLFFFDTSRKKYLISRPPVSGL